MAASVQDHWPSLRLTQRVGCRCCRVDGCCIGRWPGQPLDVLRGEQVLDEARTGVEGGTDVDLDIDAPGSRLPAAEAGWLPEDPVRGDVMGEVRATLDDTLAATCRPPLLSPRALSYRSWPHCAPTRDHSADRAMHADAA
jgi:hypothetical protein